MQQKETPDEILIERIQNGDSAALDRLIAKHQEKAYKYAYRLTRNAEEACDIVGDAFVRVYKSIGKFQGHCSFTTWLYRIMSNCFFDMRKRNGRLDVLSLDTSTYIDGNHIEFEMEDSGPTAFEEAVRSEKNLVMTGAVENLPDYQKSILIMYHMQMLSYEEIAEVTKTPLGTVKSRLNRARVNLSKTIQEFRSLFQDGVSGAAYLA